MNLTELLMQLRRQGITPTAVSYARFSSDNQRDESIAAQQRAIHEFAKSNKIVIAHEYVDRAKSATSDDREQFQQMIKDSSQHNFQFVIVHKLDRFSRNRSDSLGYRVELKKHGVRLISVIEQFDPDSPEGGLMESMLEGMAEFYSRNLAREVKKGQRENALAAKFNGGKPPFGYEVDKTTRKFVINPQEASAVELIFSMVQNHHTYEVVLDALHKAGFRTKGGNYFTRSGLYEILRNPRYTGLYVYNRVNSKDYLTNKRNNHSYNGDRIEVPGGIPAIVSQETFDEVQKILDKRMYKHKLRVKANYLLSGKIVCGECGAAYAGNRNKLRSGKLHFTYRCDSRKNKVGVTCSNNSIPRDSLEKAVLTYISSIIFNKNLIPRLVKRYNEALAKTTTNTSKELSRVSNELNGINKQIENLVNAIAQGGINSLIKRLAELETQKAQLEAKKEEIQEQSAIQGINEEKMSALIDTAKTLFEQGEYSSTRQLVDTFVEKVVVFVDRVEIILNAATFIYNGDYTTFKKSINR